jgi:hypothetical protein
LGAPGSRTDKRGEAKWSRRRFKLHSVPP